MEKQTELFDLVIIGAAAAGSAAAIYAARRNLRFVVVSKDIGGEVALSGEVENWPGTIHTTGVELANAFHKHMKSYTVPLEDGLEVIAITQEKNYHVVVAKDGNDQERQYKTKAVIIGSGIHPRRLPVPGEETLRGKGITYCTVCDGPLYKNKITATVGAGNSALESALMMAGIAQKVYVLTKYSETSDGKLNGFPRGEAILVNKLKALENVEILYDADTKEIKGTDKVEAIVYENLKSREIKEVAVAGVMVHIGMIPNSSFVTCAKKNEAGEIETNTRGETTCPGVFAAGDVTNIPHKQIVIAAGQGVVAALSAIDYINRWKAA